MPTWSSVLPVCLVLASAILTHRVALSLGIGIVTACGLAYPSDPIHALYTGLHAMYTQLTTYDNILVFVFLISTGIIIQLMHTTGTMQAYIQRAYQYIYTPLRAELTTLIGAFGFFIDDYLNAFTLGAIMGPLFDYIGIRRERLAYLINASVPALCILIPATTWSAMIMSYFHVAGIGSAAYIPTEPFGAYLGTIGYALYPICSIITAFYTSTYNLFVGQLQQPQERAPHKKPQEIDSSTSGMSLWSFMTPIITFILTCAIAFLYDGNAALIGGTNDLTAVFNQGNALFALCVGSICSSVISTLYFWHHAYISPSQIPYTYYTGYLLMRDSLIILILAWSLSFLLTEHLQTAAYLSDVFTQHITPALLPVVMYALTICVTASTGSALGTIALLLPITVRLVVAWSEQTLPLPLGEIPHAYATLAAVLSGSVAGGHISPITDATVVAATSSGAHHMTHVITQMQHSLAPLIGAGVGFIVAGYYVSSYSITLSLALGTSIAISICGTAIQYYLRRA